MYVVLCILMSIGMHVANAQSTSEGPAPGSNVTEITATTSSPEAQAIFKEALLAYDMGETRKAKNLFTKAIEKDPNMGIAYLLRAGTANSTKEWADDINQGRSKISGGSEWEKLYADYLYTDFTGNREEGLALAKKMSEMFPNAARAHANLGYAYMNNKQYDMAEAAFQKAIDKNAKWAGGYDGLSNIYMFSEKKDLTKAQQNALKAAELYPNRPGTHILLGDTYRAQNNFQKAADHYTKAIEFDGSGSEGYYKLGHAHLYLGNFEEARKNYKKGTELDERRSFGESMVATTYAYEGDTKKAMKELIKAADKYAKADGDKAMKSADEYNFLSSAATIAFHNGDAKTLKELMPRIAPLIKENLAAVGTAEARLFEQADLLNWEALLAIAEGNYTMARDKAEKMKVILDPLKDSRKLEGYHYLIGLADIKEKKFKDALDHLNQANMQSIYTKYLIARAHEGMGDKKMAQQYYAEVANYNFNNLENAMVRHEVRRKLK